MNTVSAGDLYWARPDSPSRTGVLVLAGSSGRLDESRANALAAAGATALALRWFGGVGQPPVPREVPLETFTATLGLIAAECDLLSVMGLSYGAEAALLTAAHDSRLDVVVALAPTHVVWEGQYDHDNDPPRSKWTWGGDPVPFVPLDRQWAAKSQPPAFVEHYLDSLASSDPATVQAATIPVERIGAELLLVVGGDDQVWPSSVAAKSISSRRAAHDLATIVIEDPLAGHPVALPGERLTATERPYQLGGNQGASARLGELAWPTIRRLLQLAVPHKEELGLHGVEDAVCHP